jgi:regulator of replication initiation timing
MSADADKVGLDNNDLMATAMMLSKQIGEMTFDVTAAKLKLQRMTAEVSLLRTQNATLQKALDQANAQIDLTTPSEMRVK